jgi:hypothetical protein
MIDHADERLLKMVYAMTKEYSVADQEWMEEEEAIAYERIQAMKSGKAKGLSLEETVKKQKLLSGNERTRMALERS